MKVYNSVEEFEKAHARRDTQERRKAVRSWLWGTNPKTSKSGSPVVGCPRHTGATRHSGNVDVLVVENRRGEAIGLYCRVCGASVDLTDLEKEIASRPSTVAA